MQLFLFNKKPTETESRAVELHKSKLKLLLPRVLRRIAMEIEGDAYEYKNDRDLRRRVNALIKHETDKLLSKKQKQTKEIIRLLTWFVPITTALILVVIYFR